MPAPSLAALSMKACIKHVANLRDIGNFEYWKIRPVLLRITNPEQLHEIELACPQILGEDAELWKAFIARDIPSSKLIKDLKPDNPSKWWELYSKFLEEEKKAIDRDTQTLRAAMMDIQKMKEKNVSKVMEAKYLPRQPKDPRMFANNGGVPMNRRQWGCNGFPAKPPKRAAESSKIFMKARKEAKVISSRIRSTVSPQRLPVGKSQILKAPKSMVEDYRRAAMPERIIYPSIETAPKISDAQSLAEREKRLRALTVSSHITKPATADDDDSSEYEIDDLFGERKSPPAPPPAKSQTLFSKTARPTQTTRSAPELQILPALQSKDAGPTSVTSATFEGDRKQPTSTVPELKPSDIISSIISRPKLQQSPPGPKVPAPKLSIISGPKSKRSPPTQRAPSAGRSTSSSPSRLTSPTSADITTTALPRKVSPPRRLSIAPPAAMTRKRVTEVDVFNRTGTAAKKPRVK